MQLALNNSAVGTRSRRTAGEVGNPSIAELINKYAESAQDPTHSVREANAVRALEREFSVLESLEAGWDGERGLPIAPDALRQAKGLLLLTSATLLTPDISPNPNGTLSLRWILARGVAEMEIGATRFSWAILQDGSRQVIHGSGATRALSTDLMGTRLLAEISLLKTPVALPVSPLRMTREWMQARLAV